MPSQCPVGAQSVYSQCTVGAQSVPSQCTVSVWSVRKSVQSVHRPVCSQFTVSVKVGQQSVHSPVYSRCKVSQSKVGTIRTQPVCSRCTVSVKLGTIGTQHPWTVGVQSVSKSAYDRYTSPSTIFVGSQPLCTPCAVHGPVIIKTMHGDVKRGHTAGLFFLVVAASAFAEVLVCTNMFIDTC